MEEKFGLDEIRQIREEMSEKFSTMTSKEVQNYIAEQAKQAIDCVKPK